MSKLNDNEVKEVARMQQLIDKYEQVISSLYIRAKTGKKVDVLILCKTDLDNEIRYLYRFVEEHIKK